MTDDTTREQAHNEAWGTYRDGENFESHGMGDAFDAGWAAGLLADTANTTDAEVPGQTAALVLLGNRLNRAEAEVAKLRAERDELLDRALDAERALQQQHAFFVAANRRADRAVADLAALRDRVRAVAEERDVAYPKKFEFAPSENYVLGVRDAQVRLRALLGDGGESDAQAACDGSGRCTAPIHEHGCFADRDGAACTDPTDHVGGDPE